MYNLDIKRMDHHGLVMGVIKDIGLIETIDKLVGVHADEKLSVGERVAAMIINGLGFTDQPLSLVSEFYKDLPMSALFQKEIVAEDLDRFSLSRALDRLHGYGVESLFTQVAAKACEKAGVCRKVQSFDTTTFSFHGQYDREFDTGEVSITKGYSKDHRPDLNQVVTELLVSHDSGVPLCLKNLDGNASDSVVFKERSEQLSAAIAAGSLSYVTADSKFYSEANSANWDIVKFVTRVPETLSAAKALIGTANSDADWRESLDEKTQFIAYDINHYSAAQRWLVCKSQESIKRAKVSIEKQIVKEREIAKKEVFHFEAKRFSCKADCEKELKSVGKKWKLHQISDVEIVTVNKYDSPGRPGDKMPIGFEYRAQICWRSNENARQELVDRKASFILATNVPEEILADENVISSYKNQQHVERGYRFLKDPLFFANGFYLKKPSRISALITIMTLALLVYTIAQKKLRSAMQEQGMKLPNQIGQLKEKMTIRRAFQVMSGIHFVKIDQSPHGFIQGITELQKTIIKLFSLEVLRLYQLNNEELLRQVENQAGIVA